MDAKKKDRMKTMYHTLTAIAAVLLALPAVAQGGKYGATPEDSVLCVRNQSLYGEPARNGNYAEAYPYWQEVMRLCPASSRGAYQTGAKMLRDFIGKEKDAARRNVYIDSLFTIHDMRIQHFGERGFVLGVKGVDMVYYRPEACQEAYDVLKEAIKLTGPNTDARVFSAYYQALGCLYAKGNATKDQMLADYVMIMGHIDAALENEMKPADREYTVKVRDNVNTQFFKVAECGDIGRIVGDMVKERPDDIDLKVRLLRVLNGKECTEEAIYRTIAEEVHKASPSSESAYSLGMYLLKLSDKSGAAKYFKEAVELCPSCPDRVKYLQTQGQLAASMSNASMARSIANQILQVDAKNGEAYILIGDAITTQTGNCEKPEMWGVYWAAYDNYARAKSVDPSVADKANDRMNRTSPHFPTSSDAFFYQLTEGQTFQFTCGSLSESTTVRTRK